MREVSILLVCGSARRGSTNAAVLRTVAAVADDHVRTNRFDGIGALPLFNPDDDREGAEIDPRVLAMRARVAAADALLISTPEYAGALPAALKNLLEWTIGDGGTYGKPVAWINASGPASPTGGTDAHESLAKVLRYTGAEIVGAACARIPLTRDQIAPDATISDRSARDAIAAAVIALVEHVRASNATT